MIWSSLAAGRPEGNTVKHKDRRSAAFDKRKDRARFRGRDFGADVKPREFKGRGQDCLGVFAGGAETGRIECNLPEKGEPSGVADGRIKTALSQIKETVNWKLDSVNLKNEGVETADIKNGAVTSTKPATGLGRITWYTPKIIATEEAWENVAFGFLTTGDKIENVVLPESGLILIGYQALLIYAKPTDGGSAEATCTATTANFTPLTTSSTPTKRGLASSPPGEWRRGRKRHDGTDPRMGQWLLRA